MTKRRGIAAAVFGLLGGCASGGGSTGDAELPALGTLPAGSGGTPPAYAAVVGAVASPAATPALAQTAAQHAVRFDAAGAGALGPVSLPAAFGLGGTGRDLRSLRLAIPGLGLDADYADLELADGGPVRPDRAMRWVDAALELPAARSGHASVVMPHPAGLLYGTLGRWAIGDATTREIWAGYAAFGSRTLAADVPAVGSASYSGFLDGTAQLGGAPYSVDAVASATLDFSQRALAFTTAGSVRTGTGGVRTPDATLDLAGTLHYAPGAITLSGTLTSAGGMAGTANAAFFGPQGVELAGTARLAGNGGQDQWIAGFALRQGQPPGSLPAYAPKLGCSAGARCVLGGDIVRTRDATTGSVANFSTEGSPSGAQAQIAVRVDASGRLTQVDVTLPAAPSAGVSPFAALAEAFGLAAPTQASARVLRATGTNNASVSGWVFNPLAAGLSYTTFGYWENQPLAGTDTIRGVWAGGSVSTPLAQMPATGTATYIGTAAGLFRPAAGDAVEFLADLSAVADFSARNITLQTTASRTGPSVLSAPAGGTLTPSLDLSGSLSWSATSNALSGPVTTQGGMTGSASGYFYGPEAQELGGSFGLSGPSGDRMHGGFAAKR